LRFQAKVRRAQLWHQLWGSGQLHLCRLDHPADPGHLLQVLRLEVHGLSSGPFYVTMAAAGYAVEFLFGALDIIPTNRQVVAISEGVQWNYTSVFNILFLLLAAIW
jgi:hypothetical protein